jgi:hypothetical protein
MNFLWAAIAPAGTKLFGTIGEAGRCRSSSSSDDELEVWSVTGKRIVDADADVRNSELF